MILSETLIDMKIADMLKQQKALLNDGFDINEDGGVDNAIKVKKEWDETILDVGGVSYYKMNDKCYRVSVCGNDNDIILKFRFKDAIGRWVSVSARTLREAQQVVDSIFGKHKYTISACYI